MKEESRWEHRGKYLYKFSKITRVVTHVANVPVPYQYDAQGKLASIWVTGYYDHEPGRGAFVSTAYLTPLDHGENEFGEVCP